MVVKGTDRSVSTLFSTENSRMFSEFLLDFHLVSRIVTKNIVLDRKFQTNSLSKKHFKDLSHGQ